MLRNIVATNSYFFINPQSKVVGRENRFFFIVLTIKFFSKIAAYTVIHILYILILKAKGYAKLVAMLQGKTNFLYL